MNFLKKLFVKSPEDLVSKGDRLLADERYFEARVSYEEGLICCNNSPGSGELRALIMAKIDEANCLLAERNIEEAEHSLHRGAVDKAVEHLELAKTLTQNPGIREKAEKMLSNLAEKGNDQNVLAESSSCSSCTHISSDPHDAASDADTDLDPLIHYDLLIHQLPAELYDRYAGLGEDFACMFISASQDLHADALNLLEKWFVGDNRDIYCYEKGKILHRLGKVAESEASFLDAIKEKPENPLPHLGLALLYIDEGRFEQATRKLDAMIAADIFTGQALMMRGEVCELSGDLEGAIGQYGNLLETPMARSAAERLHGILISCNRQTEAAHVFKKYLGKCKH